MGRTNEAQWKRIVARIKAGSKGGNAGQWSARKAQLSTLAYKKAGGKKSYKSFMGTGGGAPNANTPAGPTGA